MSDTSPMPTGRASLLCIASGALYFLTFLNFNLFALIWIAYVPVLLAVRGTTPKRALLLGTLFGTVTNLGGYYWVVHTIQTFGNMPFFVAVLGYVLLCAYQGFLLALAVTCVRYGERLGIAPVWSFPVALAALEVVYPLLFPTYIGNSQLEFHAITQIVEITGMAGLTLLIGFVNGAIYEVLTSRWETRKLAMSRVAIPAALFVLCLGYGLVRLPQVDARSAAAAKLTVGLVQTNIGAQAKASDPEEFVERHRAMSRALAERRPDVDLIVWPESAYNRLLNREQRNIAAQVTDDLGRPLLFGALTVGYQQDGTPQIFNSLLLASERGEVQRIYDKIELLVFGETYPFSATLPFLDRIFGTNWFTRGTSFHHLQLDGHSLLPTICYEDLSTSLVRRMWRRAGPASALVNGTNDSWYGDTHQPMEHLAVAAFRAIETRRALIRATNTGISAVVDPAGRIAHRTAQWEPDVLIADVPMIDDGSSTVYMRIGNVTGWTCVVLTLFGLWRARARRSRN
jgi:apolipoprotein N-acyltransferase